MSLLLLICLTLACLPIDWPQSVFGLGRTGSAAVTGGIVVGLFLVARVFSSRTVGRLANHSEDREAIGRAHGLRRLVFLFLNLSGFGFALLACGWGWTVREVLTVDGFFLPGAELVTLAPFLVVMVGSWAIFYDAERALHLTSPDPALRGEFWSRAGYVFFLLRHHVLIVFTPVMLVIVQLGALRTWPDLLQSPWAKLAAFVGLFVFILLLPSMVPLVLGLKPMPPGRLRSRLEAAARRLRVRYHNLYIWDTRRNLATAMVTGLVPRLRHIVFTDLLLATMTEDEIEAVFGHEVGHVRHGHLLYYAAFLMLSFLTLGAVYRSVDLSIGSMLPRGDLPLVMTVLATGGYLFLVFGFVSRRCERQADVFGCKAVSCPEPHCSGHSPETELVPGGRGLCRTGVNTFVRALERVEEVNGMARGSVRAGRGGLFGRLAGLLRFIGVWLATWQHSTISNRVAFLQTLTEDPRRERLFQWRVTALRWGLLLLLAGGVAGVIAFSGWRELLEGV
jgi:Zn-dependent protease with chaperone function